MHTYAPESGTILGIFAFPSNCINMLLLKNNYFLMISRTMLSEKIGTKTTNMKKHHSHVTVALILVSTRALNHGTVSVWFMVSIITVL